jgi:hypothetical protein
MKTYIVEYHGRGEPKTNRYGDTMEVRTNSILDAKKKAKTNYRVIDRVYLK